MSQRYRDSALYPGVTTAQLRVGLEVFIDEMKNKMSNGDAPMSGILINSHPGTGKTRLVGLIVRFHYALWLANMNAMSIISPIYEHIVIACPNDNIKDNFKNELRILFGPAVDNTYISFIAYSALKQWVNNTKKNVLLIIDEVQELITTAPEPEIQHIPLDEIAAMNSESFAETGTYVFKRVYAMTATPITNSLAQFAPVMSLLSPGIIKIQSSVLALENSVATKEMVYAMMNRLLTSLRADGYFTRPFVVHFPADLSVIRYIHGAYVREVLNPDNIIFNGLRRDEYGLVVGSNPNILGTHITFSPLQELVYRAWLLENPSPDHVDKLDTLKGNFSNPTQHTLSSISIATRLLSKSELMRLLKKYTVEYVLKYISDAVGNFTQANLAEMIALITDDEFYARSINVSTDVLRRLSIYECLDSTKLATIARAVLGVPGKKLVHIWHVATTKDSVGFRNFLERWALIRYHKRIHAEAFRSGAPRHLRRADGEFMVFREEDLDRGLIPLNVRAERPSIEYLENNYFYCFPETAQDMQRLSMLPITVNVLVFISDKLGSSHSLRNALLSIQTAKRWTETSIKQIAFRTIRGTTDETNKERYIAVLESRRYIGPDDDASMKSLHAAKELITVDEIRGEFATDKGIVTDAMTQLLLMPENNITAPMMPAIGESIINPTLTLIPEGADYRAMQNPDYDPTVNIPLTLEERLLLNSVLINSEIGKVTHGLFGQAAARKQRLFE